jgi:hypothetical protein
MDPPSASSDPNRGFGSRLGQRHLLDHQVLKVPLALQRSDPASGELIGLDGAAHHAIPVPPKAVCSGEAAQGQNPGAMARRFVLPCAY